MYVPPRVLHLFSFIRLWRLAKVVDSSLLDLLLSTVMAEDEPNEVDELSLPDLIGPKEIHTVVNL